ncbi:hypothetical protein R1flu_024116 [Riccia fluitans]|uniref:Glucosidase 2 subunit beta n=1 Tax=Riccia fluitans TaxID=41844 RepID=A0ABD1XTZ2_9MARC
MLLTRGDRASMRGVCIVYFLVNVGAILLFATESGAVPNLRGVAPQDEKYYQTAVIKCRDGSKSFSQERLNDDFCDCADGTDEPGTNACPEAKFYCRNMGHRPLILFSSRVNDGICDCCDGSDEYDGKMICRNTCWEAGEKSREKLKKKLGVYKEGSSIRKQDIENSKRLRRQHEEELVPLKRDEKHLKSVVDKLRADKEAVEKEEKRAREEKERLEKEEREKRDKESTSPKKEPQEAEEVSDQVEEHAEDPEITGTTEEEEEVVDSTSDHSDEEDEMASLTEEERGRIIASRWTGEDVSDIKAKAEAESANHLESPDDDDSDPVDDANDQPEDLEDEDYGHRSVYEDSLTDMESLEGDESWWSKLLAAPKALLKMFSFSGRQPVDTTEAERIRKEFREASDKLRDVQSKITELEERLKQDFGKDGEFYSFYGKCFELKDKKYTYKICPYKDATQQEGHSTTRLGRWQGFKDDYRSMVFEQGDRCWNGPERSMRVKMRCGTKLELRSVDEPSRCEYVAEFSTPAKCLESKVKDLEQQLVVQDVPQDESHDEL